jgi:hypothetical protein
VNQEKNKENFGASVVLMDDILNLVSLMGKKKVIWFILKSGVGEVEWICGHSGERVTLAFAIEEIH